MGREVIDNDMDLLLRHALGDELKQKINELFTGVSLRRLAEHLSRMTGAGSAVFGRP